MSGDEPPASVRPPSGSFWPALDRPIALVAQPDSMAVTDGVSINVLPFELNSEQAKAGAAIARNDHAVAGLIEDRLFSLDLANGNLEWRPCQGCSGVAAYQSGFATALSDGTMLMFDKALRHLGVLSVGSTIWSNPPPNASARYYDWRPNYTVIDAGDLTSVTIMSVPPWAFPRGGPSLLSRIDAKGSVTWQSEVAGLTDTAQYSETASMLALAGHIDDGPCRGSVTVSMTGDDLRHVDPLLAPASSNVSANEAVRLTDWSWNGTRVLVLGYTSSDPPTPNGECRAGRSFIESLAAGGKQPNESYPSDLQFEQLRVLVGCEVLLAVGNTSDGERHLLGIHDGKKQDLGRIQSVLWSAPPRTGCDDITETVRGAK